MTQILESRRRQQEDPPLNAPSPRQALRSAKLAALHARLSLPSKLPLPTLARCLIDPSVDSRPGYNNAPFAALGRDLLSYYTAEWLLCNYPRLPMSVLFAAQYAYIGSQTLSAVRTEWGVELVAAPGPEVDPGLLQLTRLVPGNAFGPDGTTRIKDLPSARIMGATRRSDQPHWRRGLSSRIVYDDEFGDPMPPSDDGKPFAGAPITTLAEGDAGPDAKTPPPSNTTFEPLEAEGQIGTTAEKASASFIRALIGALYLHAGSEATKIFHKDHILSRHLPLHTLFNFTYPTRDLSKLCAREGFEPPVARLISETGRLSRTPVFVVGVYSGKEKLGEGAGSSLNEGRVRAAAAALRSWYLYSPPQSDIVLPSEAEGTSREMQRKKWKPQMIDIGEIVT